MGMEQFQNYLCTVEEQLEHKQLVYNNLLPFNIT